MHVIKIDAGGSSREDRAGFQTNVQWEFRFGVWVGLSARAGWAGS